MKQTEEKRLLAAIKAREKAEKQLQDKTKEWEQRIEELENELLQQNINHLQLFENSVVGVALTFDGILLEINETFSQLLGYSKKELIGKHISLITHPDDLESTSNMFTHLQNKSLENLLIKKRYIRKDGTYFWGMTNVNPVYDSQSGKLRYFFGVMLNIHNEVVTQKKLNHTIEHLRDINAHLENFAHVVSHDLKAPLHDINTVIQWLKAKKQDAETSKYIALLEEKGKKMNQLIQETLSYSKEKTESDEHKLIQSKAMITETLKMFQAPHNITIELKGEFPELYLNPTKFQQIFSNLIDNSFRFINKENGLLKISVQNHEDYYQFSVFDNGKGIAKNQFDQILDLYPINPATANQNGVGLPFVKRIVNQYGGNIKIKSELNLFTEISFTFDKELVSPPE